MKKILSLFVFFALLVWTWNVIHSSPAIGFETHTAIQVKVAEMLTETLQAKRPNATQIEISNLWTEALAENKIHAVFVYKFQDKIDDSENTDQVIEGEAILSRQESEDPSIDNWKILEIKSKADSIIFREGSTINPNETKDSEPTN
jgi:hypothetical protein